MLQELPGFEYSTIESHYHMKAPLSKRLDDEFFCEGIGASGKESRFFHPPSLSENENVFETESSSILPYNRMVIFQLSKNVFKSSLTFSSFEQRVLNTSRSPLISASSIRSSIRFCLCCSKLTDNSLSASFLSRSFK